MKQRIEQLANGKFEYETVAPKLSVSEITLSVKSGEQPRGHFEIESGSSRRIRGFLYSSNPRMSFDPPRFQGVHSRIAYQADMSGLNAGETISGQFTICSDQGEKVLPWSITVKDTFTGTRGLEDDSLPSLEKLTVMARKDMQAAAAVFASAEYAAMLKDIDRIRYDQYRALLEADGPLRALEEYLISSGIKEPLDVSIEDTLLELPRPLRSERHSITLHRQGWGYQEIQVSSDARFLRPEKTALTTLDFVGDTYSLDYIIDTNFLHAGRNMGRISISTCYRSVFLDVVVEAGKDKEKRRNLRVQRLMRKKMLSLYLDFRMKRIEMSSWIERSQTVIGSYRRAGGNDVFAELFLVQMYYADGKKIKGKRMLQEIGRQMDRFTDPEQYAFYLYLTTFFERDPEYVDQVETRVEQMFLQKRDSWIIQWILLYLQERFLRDDAAKLEAIEQQVRYGCCSPIMYLEAAVILRKNPYWLRKIGTFERKILLFAVKEHLLTDELCAQVSNLILPGMTIERGLLRILKGCYEVTGSRDILKAICQLLIDNKCRDPEYFEWYSLGVAAELRLGGLYDNYMETMDSVSIEKMPQIIRMYFSYNNSLSYHKKAAIYRNISDNRESVPSVYRTSRTGIEHFITEQLELGRIDSNLAVLYERFLTRRLLTRNLAQQLVKVLFTFRVTCKNPNMCSVIVAHDCLRQETVTPLKNGVARVQIYTQQARIFLADADGKRYTSPSLYMARRYLDSPLLTSFCRELAPDTPGLIVFYTSGEEPITAESLPYYNRACDMDLFRPWFQAKIRQKVLRYYAQHPSSEGLYDFLKDMRYTQYIEAGKPELIRLLTQEGMYETAFRLVETYGSEHVDISCLVRICSQNVLIREYEEDPVLLAFCFQCYQYGKYDDNILGYLLSYYDGPVEDMKRLWETGRQNDLDTMTLEEKILGMVLFMRSGSANTESIFWSYYRKLGRKKLCRAYANMKSYDYLVKNLPVGNYVFAYIEQGIAAHKKQDDVCLLALLQYYSSLPDLSEEREALAVQLLNLYCSRDIRFDFFRKFPARMRSRAQLEDRIFLEYVADPSHTAVVFTRPAGSSSPFERRQMKNCFLGIFVKEFVLFDTEQIECYIEEYDGEEKVRTTDLRTLSTYLPEDAPRDRYAMLCRMSREAKEGNMKQLQEDLENYRQMDHLTRELFTMA